MFAVALVLIRTAPAVHDGDSLRCRGERVRLAGIDAPEMADSPRCKDGRRVWSNCDESAAIRSWDGIAMAGRLAAVRRLEPISTGR